MKHILFDGFAKPIDKYHASSLLLIPDDHENINDWYLNFIKDKQHLMDLCYKFIYESYDILSDYAKLNNLDTKLLKPMDHVVELRIGHIDNHDISLRDQIAFYRETIDVVVNSLLTLDIKVDLSLLDISLFDITRIIEASIDESNGLLEVGGVVRLACVKLIELIEKIQEVPKEDWISQKDVNMLMYSTIDLDV